MMMLVWIALGGSTIGCVFLFLLYRKSILERNALKQEVEEARSQLQTLLLKKQELTFLLEKTQNDIREKERFLEEAREKLQDSFFALSSKALERNNRSFLELAKTVLGRFQQGAQGALDQRKQAVEQLVSPLQKTLEQLETHLREVERHRSGAYQALSEQVKNLMHTQTQLQQETGKLVQALRTPHVRGQWGEVQLRKVIELAGMLEHCDFETQKSFQKDGKTLRPDLIVSLPGGKSIVVDAKVPMISYLESIEATNEKDRKEKLKGHVRLIRKHMDELAQKSYWNLLSCSPEFVVLFLPSEALLSAALSLDFTLLEDGMKKQVVIVTPTTLIALLKAVYYAWRQESLTENAKKISQLGKDLYQRLGVFHSALAKVGRSLDQAVGNFNETVGSFERRVLVSARKFEMLDPLLKKETLSELKPIERTPRKVSVTKTPPDEK